MPRAYIGQSGNVVQHNQDKDFWNRAMVVISHTNRMTQAHELFLERFAIAEGTKTGDTRLPDYPIQLKRQVAS